MPEEALLQRARLMDPEALTVIHDRYFGPLYRFISFRVGDADTTEDLVSDVFTRLLTALHQGGGPSQTLNGWLYGVASHVVNDHIRRHYRRPLAELVDTLPAAELDLAEAMDDRIHAERLRSVMNELTPEQQEVLSLRFGSGLPIREVAESMGKTDGAVKQLQARAVAQLTRRLRPEGVAG